MNILSKIPQPIMQLGVIYIGIDGFLLQGFITKNVVIPTITSTIAANPGIFIGGVATLYAANKLEGLFNNPTNHEPSPPKASEPAKTEFLDLIKDICSSEIPPEMAGLTNEIANVCNSFHA